MDSIPKSRPGAPLAVAISFAILLAALNLYFYDAGAFLGNLTTAGWFLTTIPFLCLAAGSALLLLPAVTMRQFHAGIFALSTVYFAHTCWRILSIPGMAGDNICQIAYFNILFRPGLAGSIGASFAKPGQMAMLGLLDQISGPLGESAFKIGISLVMSACVLSLSRIACDIGGKPAGIASFFVATWAFLPEFVNGDYPIYLIPVLFVGIRLYCYSPGRKALGRMLIASSILFHIQTAPVLGLFWLRLAAKRDWKELARFSRDCAISFAAWLLLILRVQGAFDRIPCTDAVGYLATPAGLYGGKLDYLVRGGASQLIGSHHHMLLFVLMFAGVLGTVAYGYRKYLFVFSGLVVLVMNVLLFDGGVNLNRNFSIYYAFGCSVGVGAIVRFIRAECRENGIGLRALLASSVVLLLCLVDYSILDTPDRLKAQIGDNRLARTYSLSAKIMLRDPLLKTVSGLMTEDDILCTLVALEPDRFRRLAALQHFNILPEARRIEILDRTDTIWIALNGQHRYYYLDYLFSPEWQADPFRLLVFRIMRTRQPDNLYGFRFSIVDADQERLILRVERTPI